MEKKQDMGELFSNDGMKERIRKMVREQWGRSRTWARYAMIVG